MIRISSDTRMDESMRLECMPKVVSREWGEALRGVFPLVNESMQACVESGEELRGVCPLVDERMQARRMPKVEESKSGALSTRVCA